MVCIIRDVQIRGAQNPGMANRAVVNRGEQIRLGPDTVMDG
jgi:hypothetical protein